MKAKLLKLFMFALLLSLTIFATACVSSEHSESILEESQGLEYELNSDGKSYSVVGIGSCVDTDIVVPSTYYTYCWYKNQ